MRTSFEEADEGDWEDFDEVGCVDSVRVSKSLEECAGKGRQTDWIPM